MSLQVCYGTTENSPVTFQSLRDDRVEKRVSTVGRAHPHVEVHVLIRPNIDETCPHISSFHDLNKSRHCTCLDMLYAL